jgi:hypothetical protein
LRSFRRSKYFKHKIILASIERRVDASAHDEIALPKRQAGSALRFCTGEFHFALARIAPKFFRRARNWRIDLLPINTLGFKQLEDTGACAGACRIGSCVDRGSSIVAEIFDLGTARAAGGFAFAAIGLGVTAVALAPAPRSGDEIADEAGEGLRHLIGKRHHAS